MIQVRGTSLIFAKILIAHSYLHIRPVCMQTYIADWYKAQPKQIWWLSIIPSILLQSVFVCCPNRNRNSSTFFVSSSIIICVYVVCVCTVHMSIAVTRVRIFFFYIVFLPSQMEIKIVSFHYNIIVDIKKNRRKNLVDQFRHTQRGTHTAVVFRLQRHWARAKQMQNSCHFIKWNWIKMRFIINTIEWIFFVHTHTNTHLRIHALYSYSRILKHEMKIYSFRTDTMRNKFGIFVWIFVFWLPPSVGTWKNISNFCVYWFFSRIKPKTFPRRMIKVWRNWTIDDYQPKTNHRKKKPVQFAQH